MNSVYWKHWLAPFEPPQLINLFTLDIRNVRKSARRRRNHRASTGQTHQQPDPTTVRRRLPKITLTSHPSVTASGQPAFGRSAPELLEWHPGSNNAWAISIPIPIAKRSASSIYWVFFLAFIFSTAILHLLPPTLTAWTHPPSSSNWLAVCYASDKYQFNPILHKSASWSNYNIDDNILLTHFWLICF